jgi:stage II sporulation protein D
MPFLIHAGETPALPGNNRWTESHGSNALKIHAVFLLIILFAFSTACGKHTARVKTPRSPIPLPSKTTKTESGKQRPPEVQPKPPAEKLEPPAAAESQESAAITPLSESVGPLIRIGLTTSAKEIRISSPSNFYFMEKIPEASRQLAQGEIRVRVEQEVDETNSAYQIQVASYSKLENAEDLKNKLSRILNVPIAIHENAAKGAHQVRAGEFQTKEEAQEFLKTLVDDGYRDAFIVKEAISTGGGKITLALRGSKKLFRLSSAGFLLQPSSNTSFLSLDGKAYRGSFDILLNKNGYITVVNQVGMEEYLLSVVPSEISPATYPEFTALAAQSIAARTYALKNMGRFRSDGFDLSDDTRTQVYAGMAAERSATNEAVKQTFGIAIYYQDKLIDAMYMSTCGGRTEDYSNVFDGPPVPYLKSVFCANESGPEKGEMVLEGKHELEQAFLADDGSLANRNLELAKILGLIEFKTEFDPEFFSDRTRKDEAIRWIEAARKIAPKTLPHDSSGKGAIDTRAGFLRFAAESFFGSEEIRQKISNRDVAYYIGNLRDGNIVPESDRFAVAYLLQKGLWRPYADNTVRPNDPIRRGDAISLLLRWIESARPDLLRKGIFMGADANKNGDATAPIISVKGGSQTREFSLSIKPCLFRMDPGQATPVSSLRIIGNEKIRFHISSAGAIDFLEVELNPAGAASDRYSPVSAWETKIARATIVEKLRGLAGNIGEFRDLKPARIGNSGRVVQIQVIGSRGSVLLNGYKVRGALGLKDTLFTITRDHNPDGSIAHFIFYGRGWGHGVGLCQVGAFGMARAGRSYEEIIKTYYQGVQIRKAY